MCVCLFILLFLSLSDKYYGIKLHSTFSMLSMWGGELGCICKYFDFWHFWDDLTGCWCAYVRYDMHEKVACVCGFEFLQGDELQVLSHDTERTNPQTTTSVTRHLRVVNRLWLVWNLKLDMIGTMKINIRYKLQYILHVMQVFMLNVS